MEFKKAYEALKQGAKIKRPYWRGFWMKENDTITMHCKDGSVIPFLETDDIFVDLDNIVADDWELLSDSEVKDLNISTFTFGEALSNLKRGKRVARKGWRNNVYLELLDLSYDKFDSLPYDRVSGLLETYKGARSVIVLNSANNMLNYFFPEQYEMLANDWVIVD